MAYGFWKRSTSLLSGSLIVFSVSACLAFAFVIGVAVGSQILITSGTDPKATFREWQTLFTGVLAVAVAGVSIFYLRRQIAASDTSSSRQIIANQLAVQKQIEANQLSVQKQIEANQSAIQDQINAQKDQAADLISRQLRARRAVLQSDLGDICQYCIDCIRLTVQLVKIQRQIRNGEHKIDTSLSMPILPERVIDNLQKLIEVVDDETSIILSDLIEAYQYQRVRLQTRLSKVIHFDLNMQYMRQIDSMFSDESLHNTISSTHLLYLRAEDLFGYARRERTTAKHFRVNYIDSPFMTVKLNMSEVFKEAEMKRIYEKIVNDFLDQDSRKRTSANE